MKYVTNYKVPLGWRNSYCGLFTLRKNGITYYFLDNEYYFHRSQVYGEFDDAERVAFFSKAVLETIRHIGANYMPNIIHCNDWHTALIPVFLHEHYRNALGFDRIKTATYIAVMATLGMAAPPVNIPAMMIASSVDMSYSGFNGPLLVIVFACIFGFINITYYRVYGFINIIKI